MKRLCFAVVLLLVAGAAYAFDAAPGRPRVGVLLSHESFEYFHDALQSELRQRGFDAFTVDASFEELSMNPDREADWYVEVLPGDAETVDYGGVGVGSRHADITLGVLVSRVGADVNIYRGRTLELVAKQSVKKKNTAVMPTSVAFGSRSLFAAIALPFVERAQVRGVARAAARELATRIIAVIRPE